jgi:hypothetical protein
MDWINLITILIALYGAILSTYMFYASRKDKRRRLTVTLSNGFLTGAIGPSEPMLFITVANPGERDMRINTPGLLLPDKQTIVWPNPQSNVSFPCDLREGTDCKIWSPLTELAAALAQAGYTEHVKLIGFCDDAVGTRHKGKPFKFQVNEWFNPEK